MDTERGTVGIEPLAWLAQEWTARLAQVLESMGDARPRVGWKGAPATADIAAHAAALAERHGPVLWWEQSFSAAPGARFWVGTPEAAWSALGKRILAAAGIEEADAADARGTYIEMLGQSLETLAHAIGAQLRREVVCPERNERQEPPAVERFFTVEVAVGEEALPPMLASASAPLAASLAPPAPSPAAVQLAENRIGAAPAAAESQMLDLLLDVELPVSISFGRTRLPLKETLKLTTGSIVELNRGVAEPVDVIVNNCVIARGEVVVIEGNYGVRIREIMSRQERIRKLR